MTKLVALRPHYGEHTMLSYTGAADATTLDLTPPSGFCYEIIDLWGMHDDGTSRVMTWGWWDGATLINHTPSASIAANIHHPFFESSVIPRGGGGLVITQLVTLRLSIAALTAGKKITMQGMYRKYAL